MVCITKVQRSTGKKVKMLEIPTHHLRTMIATVKTPCWIKLVFDDNTTKDIHYPTILTSYKTDVAVYDQYANRVYLLPDYDYSTTTTKHVHAFIEDYTPFSFMSYKDMRRDAKGAQRKYTFIENIKY